MKISSKNEGDGIEARAFEEAIIYKLDIADKFYLRIDGLIITIDAENNEVSSESVHQFICRNKGDAGFVRYKGSISLRN